jgi:hypothetical protein
MLYHRQARFYLACFKHLVNSYLAATNFVLAYQLLVSQDRLKSLMEDKCLNLKCDRDYTKSKSVAF